MPNKYKLIFFGSPAFAVKSLQALINADFEILAVVTQPPKTKGRNKILAETDLSVAAKKMGLKVINPIHFDTETIKQIKNLQADLFVVVAYGKILPNDLINLPPKGLINLHPSLLPKYRGPSPVQTALLNNETLTGITIMKLDNKVDHGPILFQIPEKIKANDDFQTLLNRLFEIGAKNLPEVLIKYLNNELIPTSQDDTQATYTKLLKKEDGLINWQSDALYIRQQILAFKPWPATYSYCKNKLYKFHSAEVVAGTLQPGEIKIDKKNQKLFIGTGKSILSINAIQPEGKGILKIIDFISGYDLDGLFFTTHPKT